MRPITPGETTPREMMELGLWPEGCALIGVDPRDVPSRLDYDERIRLTPAQEALLYRSN